MNKETNWEPKNPLKYTGDLSIINNSYIDNKILEYCDNNDLILSWERVDINIPYVSPIDYKKCMLHINIKARMKDVTGNISDYLLHFISYKKSKPSKDSTKSYINKFTTKLLIVCKTNVAIKYCETNNLRYKSIDLNKF